MKKEQRVVRKKEEGWGRKNWRKVRRRRQERCRQPRREKVEQEIHMKRRETSVGRFRVQWGHTGPPVNNIINKRKKTKEQEKIT